MSRYKKGSGDIRRHTLVKTSSGRSRAELPKEPESSTDLVQEPIGLPSNFARLRPSHQKREIAHVYGCEEAEKFEFKTVNSMVNNGFSVFEIANILEITPARVRNIKRELKTVMSRELQDVDSNSFISERVAFYNNLREVCLRAITKHAGEAHNQAKYIELAKNVEADFHSFLNMVGFYDHKRFDPGTGGYKYATDADDIKNTIDMIIKDGVFIPETPQEETIIQDTDF